MEATNVEILGLDFIDGDRVSFRLFVISTFSRRGIVIVELATGMSE